MLLNQTEVAAAFGVTTRTIRDWEAGGFPSEGTGRRRKYRIDDCIEWRVDEERRRVLAELEPQMDASRGPSLDEAKRRKEIALAEIRETELAQLRGDLLPIDEHEYTLKRIASVVLGLPRRREFLKAIATTAGIRYREAIPVAEDATDLIMAAIREVADDALDPAS